MAAAHKVIAPLIGEVTTGGEAAAPIANAVALDHHYDALRTEMRAVLQELGLAA